MSTSAIEIDPRPSWKEEVNRRVAEHKGRKVSPSVLRSRAAEAPGASRRAQEAAARVAARYAHAPSFSEVLAAEAASALRAAEAATQAAQQAQAAVQSVLAGIEAAAGNEPAAQPRLVEAAAMVGEESAWRAEAAASEADTAEPALSAAAVEPVSIRWDRELPARPVEAAAMRETRGSDCFQEQWWKLANEEFLAAGAAAAVEPEEVEPAQAIPGNIIEFPRELVATRKARPRLADISAAEAEAGVQLSIFEIDPGVLPAEPAAESIAAAAAGESWGAPRWMGIELDAQPLEDELPAAAEPLQQAAELEPATAGWRLLAIGMDAALILSAVFGAGLMAVQKAPALPGPRTAEIMAAAAAALFAGVYQAVFFTMGRSTPGMRYAHLQLCTFEGNLPTRGQRMGRLLAMLLSVLPAGLGLAWAIFDENHLSWHDRLSGSYLRRG